ncbi:hypothetical protein [Gordonia rhizosphera]|uniref:Uncharacterized protein n=1 Tax=Gordonia rhizosphera NBRC 16068 TaxID=1108045 RepID=K6WKE3_9ACTN|nr:hypothetical protein [Gordonia rhizosphera]GAB92632.1 hypothetical protein GORHZ_186_00020 [Gordonia rhizosphera NBRC 16068]
MATDPAKRNAVSQVVRQHPGMSLAAVSPGIVVFVVLWVLMGFWPALIIGLVAGGAGYYLLTRQK